MGPKDSQSKPQQSKKQFSSTYPTTTTTTTKPKQTRQFDNKGLKSYQKKDSVIELSKYINQKVYVKFSGGREVTGILKGFDPLVNLVLDEGVEHLRDPVDPTIVTSNTRKIGLVICRGTSVIFVAPAEGLREISNPFVHSSK